MLTTWILILSLFGSNDAHVTSTGPFATREECIQAGNMWLHQAHEQGRAWQYPAALCVKTTAPQPTVTY